MALNLQSILETLTAHSITEHPFLSLYLNWHPDGNGRRQETMQALTQELDMIAERVKERDHGLDSFNADRERIMTYVDTEAPPDATTLAIFACNADDVWMTLPLQVPVENQIVEDRYPHVFNLARMIDDYETYAVVLADAQESRILVISLNAAEQVAETEAAEEIKHFQSGGPDQMIFQRRTDNLIKAHTKDIGQELARIIKRYDVQHVIVAGNDSTKGIVLENLPDQIKEKLVDYVKLDIQSNLQSIMEVIDPMMRDVEHKQEADDVAQMEGEVARNGLGVAGVSDTAMALSKGQVMTLIMHQNFNAVGGECPNCGTIRAGLRDKCPYDGAELQQADLRELFTTRAVQQGSAIQVVEASEYLDQHEGVGALLRYRDDVATNPPA
ncbi:MAG: hypothetical protein H0X37_01100 [Herpetosiphonaceae bacterium]|nr:hypothetical protein [Herpetosiphonaceae bacterium]